MVVRMRCTMLVVGWSILAGCGSTEPKRDASVDDVANIDATPIVATDAERAMLVRVNQLRQAGTTCGLRGAFPPVAPFVMHPVLHEVARAHSVDMATQDYFDHNSLDGTSPFARMNSAGYTGGTLGENIAAGSADVETTFQQWLGSDAHCQNIMSAAFTETGIGTASGGEYGDYWTETFGAP
jgi:uncharacterized protein YkwD